MAIKIRVFVPAKKVKVSATTHAALQQEAKVKFQGPGEPESIEFKIQGSGDPNEIYLAEHDLATLPNIGPGIMTEIEYNGKYIGAAAGENSIAVFCEDLHQQGDYNDLIIDFKW